MRRLALLVLAPLALLAAAPSTDAPAAPAAEQPRFLLLIHDTAPAGRTAEQQNAVVAEYSAWAKSLRAQGHLIAADELADRAMVLSAKNPAGTERAASAGGYFLLAAPDLA